MSAWGTGLYQNDMGLEVKDDYRNKLRAGKTEEEVYEEIMQEYESILADDDDKFDVWFALADTMWNLGRLNDEVKEKTLYLIEQECVEEKWHSQKDISKRKKVLEELKRKMLSEMGAKKKISVHKPYVTSWKPGDVFMMEIVNPPEQFLEFKGWYIIIYVNKIKGFDFEVPGIKDICPQIYLLLSEKRIHSIDEIFNLKHCCSISNSETGRKRYQYTLAETSNRKMPKNIEYLGNSMSFEKPKDEQFEEGLYSLILWHCFVKDAITGYKLYQQTTN